MSGLLRLLFITKNEGKDKMRVAMSTKIDYIFFSTFKTSRPPAMSSVLVSAPSYSSNRFKKPQLVSHTCAALCGVAQHSCFEITTKIQNAERHVLFSSLCPAPNSKPSHPMAPKLTLNALCFLCCAQTQILHITFSS